MQPAAAKGLQMACGKRYWQAVEVYDRVDLARRAPLRRPISLTIVVRKLVDS